MDFLGNFLGNLLIIILELFLLCFLLWMLYQDTIHRLSSLRFNRNTLIKLGAVFWVDRSPFALLLRPW